MMFRTEIDQYLFHDNRKSVFSVLRSLRVSFMSFIKERLCLDIVMKLKSAELIVVLVEVSPSPHNFSGGPSGSWPCLCRAHLPLAQFGHTVPVLVSDVWNYKIF